MAQVIDSILVNLKVKFSFWQALKLRLSGILKNAETFEQVGDVTKITYIKK